MNLLEKKELEELEELEEKESFNIDNLDKASWAFKKISALKSRTKEKEELAKLEKERIDDWLSSDTKKDKESILYFESLLTYYYVQLRRNDPKAKLSTPYGKVTSRKKQPKWLFDELATLEYFKLNHPDLINIKESFNETQAKKIFKPILNGSDKVVNENGEVIDFVKAFPQDDSFTVKID